VHLCRHIFADEGDIHAEFLQCPPQSPNGMPPRQPSFTQPS
jgi:hypothetical protein